MYTRNIEVDQNSFAQGSATPYKSIVREHVKLREKKTNKKR